MLTLSAYAKINLTLEVVGRRSDGYHEVMTVLQSIDLADSLSFEQRRGIRLECDEPSLRSPHNLVLKAARLLQQEVGCKRGASISIGKGIPLAAGLGGGAADAAATLQGLNQLWGLGLSLDRLLSLASEVSSDAAFFLYGGTALGEGRGERVTPLPPLAPCWVVLLKPAIDVPHNKTQRMYAALDASHFTPGEFTGRMVGLLEKGGDIPLSPLFNVFDGVAFSTFPGLEEYWGRFLALGAEDIHLAGSGPALFTLTKDRDQAERLYLKLAKEGLETYLVKTRAKL